MEVKAEGRPPVQGPEHRKKIYSRALDRTLNVHDARAEVARASRQSRGGMEDLRAFLEAKRETIRSHARLTPSEKARALAEIDSMESGASGGSSDADAKSATGGGDGGDDEPPLPGGVGLGVFYEAGFKLDFDRGAAAEFFVLCPTRLGGSGNSWLYLTATNRASLGVEAFVAYHGQDELRFVVFDWARKDPWQVDLHFVALGPYLHDIQLWGATYQTLQVQNFTYRPVKAVGRTKFICGTQPRGIWI